MSRIGTDEKRRILSFLENRLEAGVYDTWCRALEMERTAEDEVRIPTANPIHRDWLEKMLRKPLEDAFEHLFGKAPAIVFHVDGAAPAPPPPAAITPPPAEPVPEPSSVGSDMVLNPAYTFENFIEGPSNRMAYAAARAVSETPATLYNPLFIHGGVGLGKTHLLQAICHGMLSRNPRARIVYMSCEDFVNGYIYAVQKKELEPFRARHRKADVLVVDDIHFLAGKEQSQEEFFHTFNTLHLSRRQMVLSSDQPAQDIRSLKRHLLSRFKSGFDAGISSPMYETRLAILQRKAQARRVDIQPDVLAYIASVVETNIRELEGSLTKVLGYASLTKREATTDLAKEVLRDAAPAAPAPLSLSEIQEAVARYFGKRVSDLQSRRWTKSTSLARQICVYLCRRLTNLSLVELGRQFGGKDHTTMLYSIRKVEKLVAKDRTVKSDVDRLLQILSSK